MKLNNNYKHFLPNALVAKVTNVKDELKADVVSPVQVEVKFQVIEIRLSLLVYPPIIAYVDVLTCKKVWSPIAWKVDGGYCCVLKITSFSQKSVKNEM